MTRIDISLKPITEENWSECINLKPKDNQKGHVASNINSLEKAKTEPTSKPYGIYVDNVMVGFTLFDEEPYPDDGYYWIVRLMIDGRYQGNGYGRSAITKIIDELKKKQEHTKIRISHVPENVIASKLYKELGFVETGEIIEGEIVLDLIIDN